MKRTFFAGIAVTIGIVFSLMEFAEAGRARAATLTQNSTTISRGSSSSDPVRITKLRVGGNDVDFGQPFAGKENSLEGWVIEVKNTSGQTVVDLRLSLAFETDGLAARKIHLPISYSAPLRPRETARITVPPTDLGSLRAMLTQKGTIPNFRRGQLQLQLAKFEDGSLWVKGVALGPPDPRTGRRKRK